MVLEGENSDLSEESSVEIGPGADVQVSAPDSDLPAIWGVKTPNPGQDPSEVFGSKAVTWFDSRCDEGKAHYWDGSQLHENYFDWEYNADSGMVVITKESKAVKSFKCTPNVDSVEWATTYVKPYASTIKIEFVKAEDVGEVYEIYAVAQNDESGETFEDAVINRLSSADLTFTNSNTAVAYTITGAENISVINAGNGRYEFNYDGTEPDSGTPKARVLLGTVEFSGYGKGTFGIAEADTNIVNTAKKSDNIVEHYIPEGVETTTESGTLTYDDNFDYDLETKRNIIQST